MNSKVLSFIVNNLIPTKLHHVYSKQSIWALKDVNHRHLLMSLQYASLVGCSNKDSLIGISLEKFTNLKIKDITFIHHKEKEILDSKKPLRNVVYAESEEFVSVYVVTIMPIFFENNVIALDEKYSLISQFDFNQVNLGRNLQTHENKPLQIKSEQEKYVLSLLILHKTQHEIASLLSLSRSRIVQIISKLCNQFGIEGCSTSLLIHKALKANFHRIIPPELFLLT